jgi:hypothetical protein
MLVDFVEVQFQRDRLSVPKGIALRICRQAKQMTPISL